MNRHQIQACLARMPPSESLAFLALIQAADELFARSVALRRQAWSLYHDTAADASATPKRTTASMAAASRPQQRKAQP